VVEIPSASKLATATMDQLPNKQGTTEQVFNIHTGEGWNTESSNTWMPAFAGMTIFQRFPSRRAMV
jgi:hypothetical protein